MARIVFNVFNQIRAEGLHSRRGSRLGLILAMLCIVNLFAGCAWLDTRQRQLVYRPTPGVPADFTGLRADDVSFATEVPGSAPGSRDSLRMWWLPHRDAAAPTLLYLHGTFRNLYRNLPKIEALREAGFSVLAVDYRGWGQSSPIVPSEATIYADAEVAWAELTRRQPEPKQRVIFGHSMGGGVAVELASRRHQGSDYGALILESTFTRLPDVASAAGWWGPIAALFASQKFDSIEKIGRVDAPILMIHGRADTTVPVRLGRELRDAARGAIRWVEIPDGSHSTLHSDAPEAYQRALKQLIAELR
jgi:uncharacterized protein